ncbi:substrate-binding domain-containing protein [Horticoccus sp. 23ND18S-11]|uniref:substrate-binding domain-containing protein n=1 Tax=Horticoccus sp. 23ND18S-11 TaxID=3391832 RepID=UPI0039C9BCFB
MKPRSPTLRTLARRLDLSVATVSEALRDHARVAPATRLRVQRAARSVGYEVNPLLGAALSAVRRGRHRDYRGTLALIDADEDNRALYLPFHREIAAGAAERARELGFQTELFWLGPAEPALSMKRMPGVLHARGIAGAVLLPFHSTHDLSEFDFSRLAAVQMDHCLIQPQLHTILPDHYLSMLHALEQLTQRGYRRIGLCMARRKDARIKRKWSAAFQSFFNENSRLHSIPPLIESQITRAGFITWYRQHRPDVIVGHQQIMVDWLAELGVRIPADAAFFNLNVTERTAPCAGLDLTPRRLGAAAIETVVAMLHRQERGVPKFPQTVTLEATWVDGPTLRSR